mgnify:CR=1 FL=1
MEEEMEGKKDELVSRAKEAAGALTDDEELRREGRADQAAGKVKDRVSRLVDDAREAVSGLLKGRDEEKKKDG